MVLSLKAKRRIFGVLGLFIAIALGQFIAKVGFIGEGSIIDTGRIVHDVGKLLESSVKGPCIGRFCSQKYYRADFIITSIFTVCIHGSGEKIRTNDLAGTAKNGMKLDFHSKLVACTEFPIRNRSR